MKLRQPSVFGHTQKFREDIQQAISETQDLLPTANLQTLCVISDSRKYPESQYTTGRPWKSRFEYTKEVGARYNFDKTHVAGMQCSIPSKEKPLLSYLSSNSLQIIRRVLDKAVVYVHMTRQVPCEFVNINATFVTQIVDPTVLRFND